MGRIFRPKQYSYYLGEQRPILGIITGYVPEPSPTPTPSPSPLPPSPTPTPTPTASPTPTPSITPSLTPSITPTTTVTPTITTTPSLTPSITPTTTETPTPTPTITPSPTPPDILCAIKAESGDYILAEDGNEILIDNCVEPTLPIYLVGGNGSNGYGNLMAYSTDLTSWKGVSNYPDFFEPDATNNQILSTYTDGSLWLASAINNAVSPSSVFVLYSTDAVNWSEISILTGNLGTSAVYPVRYNGTYWLLGGSTASTIGSSVLLSNDGLNWSGSTSAASIMSSVNNFTYGNGIQIATGIGGGGGVMFSLNNGLNWAPANTPPAGSIDHIAFGNNLFVGAGSFAGAGISISTDGSNWTGTTGTTLFTSGTTCWSVAYSPTPIPTYVVGGTNEIIYSNDGINWTLSANANTTFNGFLSQIKGIIWTDTQFIAVSGDGIIATSVDGNIWSPITDATPYVSNINTIITKPALGLNPPITL